MILVIERKLGAAAGHHNSQIRALSALAGTTQLFFVTAHNQSTGLSAKTFAAVLATKKEIDENSTSCLADDIAAIENIIRSAANPVSAILVPTARGHDIRLGLALAQKKHENPRICLRVLSVEVLGRLPPDHLMALRMSVQSGAVLLQTETQDMSAHIHATYGISASADLLLPCSFGVNEMHVSVPIQTAERDTFRIGYFGQPRPEKGIAIIPSILKNIRTACRNQQTRMKIEFVYQAPQRRHKLPMLKYVMQLKLFELDLRTRFAGIALKQMPSFLESDELARAMASVDLFLLPYQMPDYAFRGSGIVIDAVTLGKPIVYGEGLGMTQYLNTGNAEGARTAEEFAEKILKICSSPEAYRKSGSLAQRRLQAAYIRTENLLQTLS